MIIKKLTYKQTGVDYSAMDPFKRLAQKQGRATAQNLSRTGFSEQSDSRGESAYVIEQKDAYFAFVEEGLGTKNLVADAVYKLTGKTYYDSLAQDTVAMIINDLITVGAQPVAVMAYWAVGDATWFDDTKKMENLVNGWAHACNLAGASWGGGETPTLNGVIKPGTIDLAGAAFGVIKPKSRLALGDDLGPEDAIILFESSGIHANGLTLVRKIAERLPKGYTTKMPSGKKFGEELLKPTIIYAQLINGLLEAGVRIHYMANITGHGWRKIMRHHKVLTYRIRAVPPVPEVLQFIVDKAPLDMHEAYGNLNMGAGFAIFVPQKDIEEVLAIAHKNKIRAYYAGNVEKGKKQVIIEPLDIIFDEKTLQLKI